ncbi:MAG: hypothetical protein E2O78_00810 [Caldithrix sp.]|nr:MAG: hypothetical protein E2O78_00810 [Caldithrix sp.]
MLLDDQPNLTPETLNRFVEIFWEGKKKIVAARYGGVIGNPVLFHVRFFRICSNCKKTPVHVHCCNASPKTLRP